MPGWEILVVVVIVAAATAWAMRAAWRSVRSGKICADCSESGSCPLVNNPNILAQIDPGGNWASQDISYCPGVPPKKKSEE